jgi:hypothetical protein
MSFPDPSNYGTDPHDFDGRDYALGRHYYGDGPQPDYGGGCGTRGCLIAFLVFAVVMVLLTVLGLYVF